ncbi:MAG: peptide deformylase [Succiniclasticum sp.]|jgi:peptide deformylase|nr:peptide deformylase [Succiniclasticum sp.]MCI6223109.1 peptide deformylase [Selenomonadales bacterium]MDY2870306.1 peptide deformylase [Succiniclasticum sp.]MDY6304106.1 peptide deformylase [Succiniclasticum sp.]MDY6346340.1 peptide deformylase [Succiniclasticum sp.]
MAVLEIHTAGDPVLKTVCAPVARVDKKIKRTLKDMADTLYASHNGIGLAAPQVGILKRLIVIDLQDGTGLRELVNPVITNKEGSQIFTEGCLSVPNFEGDVERAEYVEVEYTDGRGQRQFLKADGLLAVCLQHEMDHLDGILFTDKAVTIMPKAPED